ncbi:hypothetical protein BDK51DRAFT_39596 [Blyttiomyces helicus]|uniref:Endoplasmic reticulum-based factor for assembly of V-ATPase-domain-containing protein n=1 Tax=Blyttiomyces helicus TaxID=388810 RepID=A0A4P9VVD4_9FUNG|nr:hypothetical protein BDK51DRAFT_39596 [Blyttiomyces helicus]|eukprot:RKO82775.1 hypothetical protein BDK51DRAFT_39596 [Blyttiomyces helicus]
MVSGVAPSKPSEEKNVGRELRDAGRVLAAVVNVVCSMAAVFVALFYFGDSVTRDVAMKTLLALGGALIVGVAEGWFFARDWLFDVPSFEKRSAIDHAPGALPPTKAAAKVQVNASDVPRINKQPEAEREK